MRPVWIEIDLQHDLVQIPYGCLCKHSTIKLRSRRRWPGNSLVDAVPPMSPVPYCHDVAWADLNGDGRPDMACADLENSAVYWAEHPADPDAALAGASDRHQRDLDDGDADRRHRR